MHIMITGAANGIGEALSRIFAEENIQSLKLSLVDIDDKKTEALAAQLPVTTKVFKADLSDIEALPKLIEKIEAAHGDIDLLINNAGIMHVQTLAATDWKLAHKLLQLDYISPLRLIDLTVNKMIQRGKGGFINVASMAGLTPMPGCSYYSSAKAGIAMASEILRGEVKQHGLHVVTVYPGPIGTNLEQGARHQYNQNVVRDLLPVGDREKIAREIVKAWQNKNERVIYPQIYALARHFPGPVYWLAESMSPKPTT